MQKKYIILFIVFIVVMCSACTSQQPVIVDSGDIERLRSEYQSLRNEYEQLQADYTRIIAESEFYANYYSNATAAIASGISELNELGNSMASEITKLREYNNIIRNIINNIISGEHIVENGQVASNREE